MCEPISELRKLAVNNKLDATSYEFARLLNDTDKLAFLRNDFFIPKMAEMPHCDPSLVSGQDDAIYLCGNSLGLQPRGVKTYLDRELDKWAKFGVHGHREGDVPWALCDESAVDGMAELVGAEPDEVCLMNALTVNLHLLLISFYQPTKSRCKILLESRAFPSDHYAIESQIRLRGLEPSECMICVEPRTGEDVLRTEDILDVIEREGDSIAAVVFSGVQYYTGQLFDMQTVTRAAQAKGCVVGWDLAHAVGNVPLQLHAWGVDFACWCTYKYLCTGAGGIGGAFVHRRHATDLDRLRLTGWWSHKLSTRFNMDNKLELAEGAAGYRVSNPSILLICPLLAILDVYAKTSLEELRAKSLQLTAYLEMLVTHFFGRDSSARRTKAHCEIITPREPEARGCQLSLRFSVDLHSVFDGLLRRGVACDKRLPHVIRVTPVHLYNNFTDVRRFVDALADALIAAE